MAKRGFVTRKEAAVKLIRAKARSEQTTFQSARRGKIDSSDVHRRLGVWKPCSCCVGWVPRNPRIHRSPQRHIALGEKAWSDDSSGIYHCGCELCDEVTSSRRYPSRTDTPLEVLLEEVKTKQAKPKGLRGEYDFVDSVVSRVRVIETFEDDITSDSFSIPDEDEDWAGS